MHTRRLIIIAVSIPIVAVIIAVILPWVEHQARGRAESISCGNYIVSIMCAARMWANDHNGDLPPTLLTMSNELNSPKILRCPGDLKSQSARAWTEFTEQNSSYQVVSPDMREGDTNTAYLRCKVHGHVGYADATVFDGNSRRTKKMF
jgi:hypothetical protein